jgi:hypothetical protein
MFARGIKALRSNMKPVAGSSEAARKPSAFALRGCQHIEQTEF